MKTILKITIPLVALILCGRTATAQPHFPVVLTQKLATAPKNIVANSTFIINVIQDTSNYIAVVTNGTVDEIDDMRFPTGKLNLSKDGTCLTMTNSFPYRSNIQIHTTTRDLTVNAKDNSQIMLTSHDDQTIKMNTMLAQAEDNGIIFINSDVEADEVSLYAKDNGTIRYNKIDTRKKNTEVHGAGRVIGVGDGEYSEAMLGWMVQDHQELPIFMDWAFGSSTLSGLPFGGWSKPTDNFIWGVRPVSYFAYSGRYAFWQKPHWDISTGIGVRACSFEAQNAYLEVATDAASGENHLTAADAHALFASEEAANGPILWSSTFSAGYIYVPLRIEWRQRSDYKGIRIAGELQPGFSYFGKKTMLIRKGIYQNRDQVASTRDESLRKYLNPFMLGMRLTASWKKVSVFAESSLTPMFRSQQNGNKKALNQKLYPLTTGICFTF